MEQDYGDRLRVIFRHMPLQRHEHALLAARAAEAAGLQGRFWEMHDLLFQNSLRWTKGVDTVGPDASPSRRLESKVLAMELEVRDVFLRYAEMLQLDVERFKQDLDSDQVKARVESDRAKGVALGIDRTPTIYVNGHLIPAPSSLTAEGLHAAIDAALDGKVYEHRHRLRQSQRPNQQNDNCSACARTIPNRKLHTLAALLAVAGLADSIYLTVTHLTGEDVTCLASSGCSEVLSSAYASVGPIPLGAFGALGYFLAFSLAVAGRLWLPTRPDSS